MFSLSLSHSSSKILALVLLSLSAGACSSVPMVTVPEEEFLALQRQVRVLSRDLSDTQADYQAERGEQLRSREYLRKVEHPLTLKEEQERAARAAPPPVVVHYYGETGPAAERPKEKTALQKLIEAGPYYRPNAGMDYAD